MRVSSGGIPGSLVQGLHRAVSGRKKPFQTLQELHALLSRQHRYAQRTSLHPNLCLSLPSPTISISDGAYSRCNHCSVKLDNQRRGEHKKCTVLILSASTLSRSDMWHEAACERIVNECPWSWSTSTAVTKCHGRILRPKAT